MSLHKREFESPAEDFVAGAIPGLNPKFRDQLIFDAGVASAGESEGTARLWKAATGAFCVSTVCLAVVLFGQTSSLNSSNIDDSMAEAPQKQPELKEERELLTMPGLVQSENRMRTNVLRVGDYGMVQNEIIFAPSSARDRHEIDNAGRRSLPTLTLGDLSGFDETL